MTVRATLRPDTIVEAAQARLLQALRALGGRERAEQEKRYQKSRWEHWGVPLPGMDVAINALTPQVAIVNAVGSGLVPNSDLFEPVETMAEAALALCTGDPSVLTGRIAYSLQLLLELDRPVFNLTGEGLVDGWQPADLVAAIQVREKFHEGNNWPQAFDFHRVHTPYPRALKGDSAPVEG